MARINVTQDQVVDAVIVRLKASLGIAAGAQSNLVRLVADISAPAIPPGGEAFYCVQCGGGSFLEDGIIEQAPEQCCESMEIHVAGYNRVVLDPEGRDEKIIRAASRGTNELKRKILAALVGQDLVVTGGSNTFHRQAIVVRSGPPELLQHVADQTYLARVVLTFVYKFDWNLA